MILSYFSFGSQGKIVKILVVGGAYKSLVSELSESGFAGL